MERLPAGLRRAQSSRRQVGGSAKPDSRRWRFRNLNPERGENRTRGAVTLMQPGPGVMKKTHPEKRCVCFQNFPKLSVSFRFVPARSVPIHRDSGWFRSVALRGGPGREAAGDDFSVDFLGLGCRYEMPSGRGCRPGQPHMLGMHCRAERPDRRRPGRPRKNAVAGIDVRTMLG